MEETKMLSLPAEVLFLWHAHRTEILISAGILLVCIRLITHWRKRGAKAAHSPPLGFQIEEKKLYESTLESDKFLVTVDGTHSPSAVQSPPTVARPKSAPRRVTGVKRLKSTPTQTQEPTPISHIQPHIFFFSLTGTTKTHAEALSTNLNNTNSNTSTHLLPPHLHDLSSIDYDDYFITPPQPTGPSTPPNTASLPFYLLLLPTYDIPTDLDSFTAHLQETHHDFRIDTHPLSSLAGYAVFGFGDKRDWPTEEAGFCSHAVDVDKWMARLTGRKRAFPLGVGDVASDDVGERLGEWWGGVCGVMRDVVAGRGLGEGVVGSGGAVESGDEDGDGDEDEETLFPAKFPKTPSKRRVKSTSADLEDLRPPIPVDFTTTTAPTSRTPHPPKPMVPPTSPTHAALTKQGYTIVGSHSGVKTCRWTKSALRGRGSCYKFSFYGIASHLCMEATPSLACANKCVFCWRHGTNPVATSWKWQVDPPEEIFQGMKAGHYRKIKALKGVPGVRAERFAEAMRIRHCALSLVGEPIFYPHINALLAMLHAERISTFLVCNAQHPDHLAALGPVTQLYVSIDAANKDSLKRIDRPLHRDFWQRFLRCMDILRAKRFTQRTVFRLTLVKGFNVDEEEVRGYADLVARALPAFVEVKGVTYCGTSSAAGAGLTMRNVPFYAEVTAFVRALEAELGRRGLGYGIAAEHAHSCCVLLADRSRFFRPEKGREGGGEKKWHTRIDFEGFFDCLERGVQFGPEDYLGDPTPEWALWGNGGFDPRDERVDRKGRKVVVEEIAENGVEGS